MAEEENNSEHHKTRVVREHTPSFLERARENPWIITSIVLAVLLLLVIVFGSMLFGGKEKNNFVSSDVAAQNLISFINAQGKGNATLVSAKQEGGLYNVVVEFKGQQVPVYVTLDGKNMVFSPVPLSLEAQTAAQQQQQPAPPTSDKPVVELFVMSYCPYGTQMEKGIIPVVNLLKDKINFTLRFVSYSMHGKQEIDDNTRQYCIQKEQGDKFIPYLTCFLQAQGKSDSCLDEAKINKGKLIACVAKADQEFDITKNYNNQSSWLSGQYPMYNVNKAENEEYGVQGSPTLIINGVEVSSGRDSASLLQTICAAFNTASSECSQTLSSTQPSAGFGTSDTAAGTAGAATGAGCAA